MLVLCVFECFSFFAFRILRRKFPNLTKLNEKDLPPLIGFEVEDVQLPTAQKFATIHPDASTVVIRFLEAYYNFFDSADRQPLLDAYADKALFSLTSTYGKCYGRSETLNKWFTYSRNCENIDNMKIKQLLKRGKLNVVATLTELPKTQHDSTTFTMDVTFASDQMIVFSLTGLFREVGEKLDQNGPVRYFSRTGILAPLNAGWVMVNDMWSITNASREQQGQISSAAKPPVAATSSVATTVPAPVAVAPVVPAATVVPGLIPAEPTPEIKRAMIEQFSTQSGMNLIFSQRCLEENLWDFMKAGERFLALKNTGVIPPEAFIK